MKIKAIILLAILVISTLSPAMAYNVGDSVNGNIKEHTEFHDQINRPDRRIYPFPDFQYTQKGHLRIRSIDENFTNPAGISTLLLNDEVYDLVEGQKVHNPYGDDYDWEVKGNYTFEGVINAKFTQNNQGYPWNQYIINATKITRI